MRAYMKRDGVRWVRLCAVAALVSGLSGCAVFTSPVLPPIGAFTSMTAPVDIEFNQTEIGPIEGRAKAASVLGLVSWGDASVAAAAAAGGLTSIDQIDCRIFNVLGIYVEYETIVTGRSND